MNNRETVIGRIRSVVFDVWDPIGISKMEVFDPKDSEYDRYIFDIADLLSRGASKDNIIEYLRWAEEYIGVDVMDSRILDASEALSKIRSSPSDTVSRNSS